MSPSIYALSKLIGTNRLPLILTVATGNLFFHSQSRPVWGLMPKILAASEIDTKAEHCIHGLQGKSTHYNGWNLALCPRSILPRWIAIVFRKPIYSKTFNGPCKDIVIKI
ncbi:MAG: hypothetical protein Q8M99_02505 [Methylotenera sp.]|nr:hypothetical protein [Methylotenera sp.]